MVYKRLDLTAYIVPYKKVPSGAFWISFSTPDFNCIISTRYIWYVQYVSGSLHAPVIKLYHYLLHQTRSVSFFLKIDSLNLVQFPLSLLYKTNKYSFQLAIPMRKINIITSMANSMRWIYLSHWLFQGENSLTIHIAKLGVVWSK